MKRGEKREVEKVLIEIPFFRLEITTIQQAIKNMYNMVMNHRGKTRSKGMGIETQLKQVDFHFVFSINRNLNNHIIDRITDNGTFRGSESVERGDGFLETRRLQRPSSHRCNFPQALLALTRSHKAHSSQENKLVSHLCRMFTA